MQCTYFPKSDNEICSEYNMRNIFLEKSFTKFSRETTPRPSSKKKIEHISESIV